MAIDATTHRNQVLLIPSTECGWSDVRNAVAALTSDTVVRETTSLRHARRLAAERAPDLVLAAGRVAGESSVPFLRRPHRDVCPHRKILVIRAAAVGSSSPVPYTDIYPSAVAVVSAVAIATTSRPFT